MTALAFLKLGSRTLLLAGEGPFLRIYNYDAQQLLLAERIFKTQSLHGICTQPISNPKSGGNFSGRVLIWGGRSICLFAVEDSAILEDQYHMQIQHIAKEIEADDWIFDACFSPLSYGQPKSSSITVLCKAVLVTAHNALLALNLHTSPDDNAETSPSLECIAVGLRSILYSAHVIWPQDGRVLVAAGTVLGEVLLWSLPSDQSLFAFGRVVPGHLHYTFTGHEGSVFGVQISDEAPACDVGFPRRILASCSDDRTIKIWDISYLRLDADGNQAQNLFSKRTIEHLNDNVQSKENSCLFTVMAHNSRIWGVRFLHRQNNAWILMSYGEDGTAQVWQLNFDSCTAKSGKTHNHQDTPLTHQSTFANHSGKNIWSMATYKESYSRSMISTGGADGRIASYFIRPYGTSGTNSSWSSQWSMQEAYGRATTTWAKNDVSLKIQFAPERSISTHKILFQGLQGQWKLHRNLRSAIPLYPSGSFEGSAVFEARDPTDEAYDLEYLYIENGKFTTEQGFIMEAARRYVYRFQEKTDTISAWFVCTRDQSTVDYLFHTLKFENLTGDVILNEENSMAAISANGHHLCIDDDYHANYEFQTEDAVLPRWELTHIVKGPNKDYVADAHYIREIDFEQSTVTAAEATNSSNRTSKASKTPKKLAKMKNSGDSFKNYAWINEDCFMTSTEHGNILLGILPRDSNLYDEYGDTEDNLPAISWENVGQINGLKSYCTITNTRSCQIAVLGGSEGDVYVYQHPGQIYHATKFPRKVAYLSAHIVPSNSCYLSEGREPAPSTITIFASCLGTSTAYYLVTAIAEKGSSDAQDPPGSGKSVQIFHNTLISLPSHFIPTSSLIIDTKGLLVLGSRSGRLSIYDLLVDADCRGKCSYLSDNIHGHGEDLITTIESVPVTSSDDFSNSIYILTTGRDGKYSVHQVFVKRAESEEPRISLQTVHTCTPPFGPNIEGARFLTTTNDLLLWGFRSTHFVAWNETKKLEVMNVECGGANRNWAYTPQMDGNGGGSFVRTKASVCHISSQAQASHQVLQYGGHGREIKAMAISPQIIGRNGYISRFIATGAEDTAIRIFSYDPEGAEKTAQGFECVGISTKHKAGIQQLKWSSDGKYLFSAAGFEEFFIWRVRSVPLIGVGVVCEATFPPVSESSDLRIMDFDILEIASEKGDGYILSLVYSDSSIRVRYPCPFHLLGFC